MRIKEDHVLLCCAVQGSQDKYDNITFEAIFSTKLNRMLNEVPFTLTMFFALHRDNAALALATLGNAIQR
jgi:hypothetical protein